MRERLKKEREAKEKREKAAVRYLYCSSFPAHLSFLFCSASAVGKPMQKGTVKSENSKRKKQSSKRSNKDSQRKRKMRSWKR